MNAEEPKELASIKKLHEKEFAELASIKKLLVLQLLNNGVQQAAIAKLLGIDQGNFSKTFPAKKLLKQRQKSSDEQPET